MESWAQFVESFTKVREVDGTLLDNTLVLAHSDVSFAKVHDVLGIPAMLAGRAGGKVKTGLHIDGKGMAGTRVGYTALKLMGVNKPSWGVNSNNTSQEVGDILV